MKNENKYKNLKVALSIGMCIMLVVIAVAGMAFSKKPVDAPRGNQNINTNTISIGSSQSEPTKIDVNTASLDILEELEGIGEIKAQKIKDNRPYRNETDLMNVIGKKLYDKNKNQISLGND